MGSKERELAGGEPLTTNNRMELMAAIKGLEALKRPCRVTLHTDSEYNLPKASELPADGKVTIWIVTHDERAGSDWRSTTITVVP